METELLSHFHSPRKSIEERLAAGKAFRKKSPRIGQAEYTPSPKRKDPVAILKLQAETRLQELVPIRYARMLTSPFAFLRGGAAIMAADLAASGTVTGLNVQACGDMHIANFGVFATVERNLVFGINDFDETIPGPFEWDLKRMVASIVAAGRFLGASDKLCKEGVMASVSSYRKRMKEYAQMGCMELWYSNIRAEDILKTLSPSARQGAEKIMAKARQRTSMQMLGKMSEILDDQHRLKENAPFLVREKFTQSGRPIEEALGVFLDSYFESLADDRKSLLKNYRIADAARKVVGVGSVGTRCWVILMTGNHPGDPLFLQLKEAQRSVLEPFTAKSAYENQGKRVVAGQRLIQAAPDIFLGWGEIEGMHFYVRQLRDMKGGVEFDPAKTKVAFIPQYAALCGWALAQAHAKSCDPAILAGYVGGSDVLDEALATFAFAYNNQTEKDYKALQAAAKSKKIKVADKAS